MGEEDPSNLTLKKLQKTVDDLISQKFRDDFMGIYNRLAQENFMGWHDLLIINRDLYNELPDPKPSWLKPSSFIKKEEGYVIKGIESKYQ